MTSLILADAVLVHTGSGGGNLITALVTLVVVGVICYLLWWFLDYLKLPPPFDKVGRVLVALVALVFLINFLLGLIGKPFITW